MRARCSSFITGWPPTVWSTVTVLSCNRQAEKTFFARPQHSGKKARSSKRSKWRTAQHVSLPPFLSGSGKIVRARTARAVNSEGGPRSSPEKYWTGSTSSVGGHGGGQDTADLPMEDRGR